MKLYIARQCEKKKNGEKKVKEIIVRNILNTILFINEHGSIRSKWRCLFYALKKILLCLY